MHRIAVTARVGVNDGGVQIETLSCMTIPRAPATQTVFDVTGYAFAYVGGAVTETPNLSAKVDRRICAGWMNFRPYTRELYDRPKSNLLYLKGRMLKSEIVEALLYRYATWTPFKGHCNVLRIAHRRMLPRIHGAWCKWPNNRILSYKNAFQQPDVRV